MTGETRPLSTTESRTTTFTAPAGLPTAPGSYIQVDISADIQAFPAWKQPIKTHFRRTAAGLDLVGLERLREGLSVGGVEHVGRAPSAAATDSPSMKLLKVPVPVAAMLRSCSGQLVGTLAPA